MTRKEFYTNLDSIYFKPRPQDSKIRTQFRHMIDEFEKKWISKWKNEVICAGSKLSWNAPIPTKFKFSHHYKRKVIVKFFKALDLTVTRYTNEYGRTIVYFEATSDLNRNY